MNLGTIYDMVNNIPVAIICNDYKKGDIAYFSIDNDLLDCLDIITNNPLYFLTSENFNGNVMVKREEVDVLDSYYLLAINFNLPVQWKIIKLEHVTGDIEELVNQYSIRLGKVGDEENEQIERYFGESESIEQSNS